MTTLIILVILFAIAIISLIIISIKKFSDKINYILIKLNSLDDDITDIDNENQKITNTLNEKITSILNKTIKIDSRFITLHETIKDNLNNIEVAIKSLTNSINAIEENDNDIIKSLKEITEFNEHHRRVMEMLDNKIIAAKIKRQEISDTVHNISDTIRIIRQNIEGSEGTKPGLQKLNNKLIEFYEEINVIKQTLSNFDEVDCSRHQTIYDILKEIKKLTTNIAEDYSKIIDLQAKNSSLTDKVKKSSPAKSKHRTRAKKAENSYNPVHDPLQEKVNEEQLN